MGWSDSANWAELRKGGTNLFLLFLRPRPIIWVGPELVRPKVHWNSGHEL